MLYEEKKALANIRFEKANECLADAEYLLSANRYKSAANRSYYAIFHAMRSVLAFDGVDMKHHSGIMSEFRRRYVKTGIFDTELSRIISTLSNSRTESDYDDFFVISKAEVIELVQDAKTFLSEIEKHLKTQ